MTDVSLDDYMKHKPSFGGRNRNFNTLKKGTGTKMQRNNNRGSGNIQNRLGLQTASAKNTQFTVTLGGKQQKQFDIREKLSLKKKIQIKDARDEIAKKTKFVDARVRIQAKKKPLDARDKLTSKQQKPVKVPVAGSSEPKVMVTGLGRVHHVAGHIVADEPPTGGHLVLANSSNIIVTAHNNEALQLTSQPGLVNAPKLPKVMVKNEFYQQPKPVEPRKRIVPPAARPKPQTVRLNPRPAQTVLTNVQSPVQEAKLVAAPVRPMMVRPAIKLPIQLSTPIEDSTPDVDDVISPLQGFRIMITNLHPNVTEEDIVELFSAIGALKRARLIKLGIAEVVFVQKQDAVTAVKKYHNRELDGMPMLVNLTGIAAKLAKSAPVAKTSKVTLPAGSPLTKPKTSDVDISVIHKALFKTASKADAPSKPVTFTIKI